ncbi:Integrase core domain-containing protein [Streptomyces melanosporofaciens]|uniref:Integrase core domain-containing protein n=1 Tax=Streptomyces melanosporofaciens TaxID=67327 RepID=A0A1H4KF17_STRMJ|nr:Integrase core domain-containing protein [Streptomyces melanosporofaciens]
MNSLMERWIQTCRSELLDRTLIWNQGHLLHALREYESFYNEHRPHRALQQAAPCRPLPTPITQQAQLAHLAVHRRPDSAEPSTNTSTRRELGARKAWPQGPDQQ